MSVSLWAYTEHCDGQPCCGDCDRCTRCESRHIERHEYSNSDKAWYLCRECGKVWEAEDEIHN